jgi:nucleotidyltransferase substrate binding protein (TIGR01987 family)
MNVAAPPPLDLTPLQGALTSLRRGLARWQAAGEQDEELRDACIQRFEYTFELSWKMLARRLERDLADARSVDAMSFRELMRSGGERGLVRDVAAWMIFRDKRNTTSHTYNAAKAADVAAVLPAFADEAQALLTQLQNHGAADA